MSSFVCISFSRQCSGSFPLLLFLYEYTSTSISFLLFSPSAHQGFIFLFSFYMSTVFLLHVRVVALIKLIAVSLRIYYHMNNERKVSVFSFVYISFSPEGGRSSCCFFLNILAHQQ